MRVMPLALLVALAAAVPAHALTVTARVSGGNIAVHEGPGARYAVIGRLAEGSEIPIDQCTQVDADSARSAWIGDAGYGLRGDGAGQWCRVPGQGWVDRSSIVGRGLVNVTPPDFAGPGW